MHILYQDNHLEYKDGNSSIKKEKVPYKNSMKAMASKGAKDGTVNSLANGVVYKEI